MADNNNPKTEGYDSSRRNFLKNTGLVVGGVAGGSLLGGLFTSQLKSDDKQQTASVTDGQELPSRARMFFGRFEDFATLAAATELIFPKDETGPGAIELEVPFYIDKQLAGMWGVNGQDYRQAPYATEKELSKLKDDDKPNHVRANRGKVFLDGLRTMNAESQKRFGAPYYEASEEQQGEIMNDLAEGNIAMNSITSEGFFALLKQATLEGAYCDPLYGGNKDMAGWQMKEFGGAQMSYADVIESEDFVKMDPMSLKDYQRSL